MNIIVPLVLVSIVLFLGIVFALFPRWWMRVLCRCARTYMAEDLSADPTYVLAFRFYGLAAVGLAGYALFQILQAL